MFLSFFKIYSRRPLRQTWNQIILHQNIIALLTLTLSTINIISSFSIKCCFHDNISVFKIDKQLTLSQKWALIHILWTKAERASLREDGRHFFFFHRGYFPALFHFVLSFIHLIPEVSCPSLSCYDSRKIKHLSVFNGAWKGYFTIYNMETSFD